MGDASDFYKQDVLHEFEGKDTFTKHDAQKTRLELIEPKFIQGLGEILTFGANKYSANNWKNMGPDDVERVKGALLRHLMEYMDGTEFDSETGKSHLYHAACNLMFLDFFDRHKKGKVLDACTA
jgi:hypothetical protein